MIKYYYYYFTLYELHIHTVVENPKDFSEAIYYFI